jgi:aldose 1-epimerase
MIEVPIGGDAVQVVVLPDAGARLHRIRAFGHDLLRAPDDPAHHRDDPFMWGGYVMAPWCNRIRPARVDVAGRTIDLEANFVDGTAIHGQVFLRPWLVDGPGSFAVDGGGDGWPWRYAVHERVTVIDASVRVELQLTNLDDAPMPAGIGIHPWFLGPPNVAIRGDVVFDPNTETPALPMPVAGPTDLRRMGEMAEGVDATWGDLVAGGRGIGALAPVELHWPDFDIRAEMRVQAPAVFVVAAHPPGADVIAVEPETHAPEGIRRLRGGEPGAMAMLAPGDRLELSMELVFERG